jgi:UDP-N-acetylglucosamine--N-acetylmuramyl-(pentapeptide) pyrophosphoryl-undecaprenol N-acetylglucosamine transferase
MSDVVPAALAALPPPLRARLAVAQQCRAEDLPRVRAAYREATIAAECAPFFADVPARLAGAHLVIARAGASTLAELAVIGRPAILVPLPGAIDDHQSANARAFGAGGLSLAQPDFTPARLAALLAALLADPARLAAMAAAARRGPLDAAERLADLTEAALRVDARGAEARP